MKELVFKLRRIVLFVVVERVSGVVLLTTFSKLVNLLVVVEVFVNETMGFVVAEI
jgi:hypothetical protein